MKKGLSAIFAMVLFLGITSAFAAEKKADPAVPAMYWAKWEKGTAKGIVPPCGTNVLPLGGDDILQATVDTYCGVKPGKYESYISPEAMKAYKAHGNKYPDGKVAVLEFKEIGAAFTTDIVNGRPVYDVVALKDGKSIASKDPNHPLNPATCEKCHASFNNACVNRGYTCGNR